MKNQYFNLNINYFQLKSYRYKMIYYLYFTKIIIDNYCSFEI